MSKERMQKQKEDTLRQILDQSWNIAIHEGMQALSIRKIAAAMNFAPNNLYHYFKNKNELLLLLKKDAYQWTIDIIKEDVQEEKSVCALFIRLSKRILQSAIEEPEKYIVMTSDVIMDDQEPMDQEVTGMVARMIEAGIASGELKEMDPVATAVNIRMIVIAFMRMVSSSKTINLHKAEEMHDNLMNILYEGIRKEKDR